MQQRDTLLPRRVVLATVGMLLAGVSLGFEPLRRCDQVTRVRIGARRRNRQIDRNRKRDSEQSADHRWQRRERGEPGELGAYNASTHNTDPLLGFDAHRHPLAVKGYRKYPDRTKATLGPPTLRSR